MFLYLFLPLTPLFCLYFLFSIIISFFLPLSSFSFPTRFSGISSRKRVYKLSNLGICLIVSLIDKTSREKHLSDLTYNSMCSRIPDTGLSQDIRRKPAKAISWIMCRRVFNKLTKIMEKVIISGYTLNLCLHSRLM